MVTSTKLLVATHIYYVYRLFALKWIQPLFMQVAMASITFQGALNGITINNNNNKKNNRKKHCAPFPRSLQTIYNVNGYRVPCRLYYYTLYLPLFDSILLVFFFYPFRRFCFLILCFSFEIRIN